jgi:hypothetical protein
MIHEVNGWEEDEDAWDNGSEDDSDDHEMVLACGYPDCCMPGYHFRSECHNGTDIEAMNAEFEAESKQCNCTFGEGANFHLPECPMRQDPTSPERP